ncbi:hypothetical protein [Actinocorallia populi]|uniref:hypothetical protein n=1 Tax=Actinocorallia populi TaxID=2079200 RepID=UPI000D08BDD8|nr:hypothetical protein [Actinocorallia populi]
MSQDPYTTRRDFALPGQPSPEGAEGGQDGSDVTPPLGAAYPEQRPPAIDFAQTVRDPAPSGGEETMLDRTRPVPMPQREDPPAGSEQRDVPVAPVPAAPQQPPQPPQQPFQAPQGHPQPQAHPQQGFPPQGYAPPPAPSAPAGGAWHRQHYAIGVFLVLYGLTNLATGLLGFGNRKLEAAVYFGDGLATPVLIAVKCAEALLLAVTAAGLVRRRDLWFLPALLAWVAGFAVLCVLDIVKGEFLTLAEHAVYTLVFGFLLFLSYALSTKVRATRAQAPGAPGQQAPPAAPGAPAPAGAPQQGGPPPAGLSRTQEIALNTLNRWQRPGGR